MDCFHQQYLQITAVLTVAGHHSPVAFGDRSRRIWEVTVQNDMLWCVEGQGRKLSYYQPPLVKAKANFHKKYSSCPREEGTCGKPWSLSQEEHATEKVVPNSKASPWHHEILIWKDSGCIFQRLKCNFLIQWWWRAEKNLCSIQQKMGRAISCMKYDRTESTVSITAWQLENMKWKY